MKQGFQKILRKWWNRIVIPLILKLLKILLSYLVNIFAKIQYLITIKGKELEFVQETQKINENFYGGHKLNNALEYLFID